MMRRIKKGSAILLAAALVFSALALPKAYAAVGIEEPENGCSITLNVPTDTFSELEDLKIPVNLYKVADIGVGGDYTAVTGISTSLSVLDSDTTAGEMETLAASLKTEIEKDSMEPTRNTVLEEGTATVTELGIGLYAVIPETVNSAYNQYEFSPTIVSLPGNNYYKTGDDTWIYNLTEENAIALKPEKADRYGDLKIVKNLNVYNETLDGATFVFKVEATKTDVDTKNPKVVYSNVVAIDFNAPGEKFVLIEDIPAGADVTVTEIYTGASYKLTSDAVKTTVIIADGEEGAPATVDFSNTYDYHLNGGNGVVNSFIYNQDAAGNVTWTHSAMSDSTEAQPR